MSLMVESLGRLEDGVEWYWLGQYLAKSKPPFFCMCPGGFMRSRSGNSWLSNNGYPVAQPRGDDATYPLTSIDRFVQVRGRDPFYMVPNTLVMFFNISSGYEWGLTVNAVRVAGNIRKGYKLIDLVD